MKTLIKLLFVMFLPIGICDADAACGNSTKQDYITALINTDYEVRNKALLDLHECPDKLSTPEIQQAILNLVDREIKIDTQWYKDDKAGKNPPSLGEDYGDYLIDLQKTLFSISDNPKTLHALLDSTSISGWNIDDRLVKTYGEKLVPGLARQFNNKTMWKENRRIV